MNHPLADTPCPLHPERNATRICKRCGSFACPECSVGEGANAFCVSCSDSADTRPKIPFEHYKELKLLPAFLETMKGVMLEPGNFWRRHAPPTDNTAALLFCLLLVVPMLFGAIAMNFISPLLMTMLAPSPADLAEIGWILALNSTFGVVWSIFYVPTRTFLVLTLMAALTHGLLVMMGGASKDLAMTWRVAVYTAAPRVLEALPILGNMIAFVWLATCRILGYREAHETTTAQAAGAVLLPYMLCFLCCGGVMAAYGAALWALIESGNF